MLKKSLCIMLCIASFVASADAKDTKSTGQNAFTRAAKKPLANVATPVTNKREVQCYSVVDCRRKGSDLGTVWKMNHGSDHSPKDYPANCYVPGDGKYVYSAAACR